MTVHVKLRAKLFVHILDIQDNTVASIYKYVKSNISYKSTYFGAI